MPKKKTTKKEPSALYKEAQDKLKQAYDFNRQYPIHNLVEFSTEDLVKDLDYQEEQDLLQWYAKWCKSHPYKRVN